MTDQTTNYGLNLPTFDTGPWHDLINSNFVKLDTIIKSATGLPSIRGGWLNSVLYAVGDRVIDPQLGTIWINQVEHTSASAGTFAEDRVAHPTYWKNIGTGWAFRGEWENSESYVTGDVVYSNAEYLFAVANVDHNSPASGTLRDDITNWDVIFDGQMIIDATDVALVTVQQDIVETNERIDALPKGLRGDVYGLIVSNSLVDAANDIVVSSGYAVSDHPTAPVVMQLASSITKRLDATWAVGTDAGGRDSAQSLADGWWHVFLIHNPTSNITDVLLSTSASSPTLPTGYTHKALIMSVPRSTSLVAFTMIDDIVTLNTLVTSRNSTSSATDALVSTYTPPDRRVRPLLQFIVTTNSNGTFFASIANGDSANSKYNVLAVSAADPTTSAITAVMPVYTDLSQRIRFTASITGTVASAAIYSHGWQENRGRKLT